MSRGFVKEDDQEEAPFIPPRAPLPDGIPNYVTPRGLRLLRAEREALETELRRVQADPALADYDRRRLVAEHEGRLALLQERIVTAREVDPSASPGDVARFGSSVRFRYTDGPQMGKELRFTIVGVDEADVREGRIAFIAPIARALIGKRPGDRASFQLGANTLQLLVLEVSADQL